MPSDEDAAPRDPLVDLAGIIALAARSTDGDPRETVGALLGAVVSSLGLAFALARLIDLDGPAVELIHAAAAQNNPDGDQLTFASARIGLDGELGVFMAASCDPEFPRATEKLVIDVAAAQAALVLGTPARVALRNSARQFRLLVDTIPALVWRGTAEGDLDFLNQRAVEYLGHTAESLSGGRWLDVVHPDHRDATVRRWMQSVTAGTSYDDIYKLRRADGQFRWTRSIGHPVRDADGRIVQWYGVIVDVEERKRIEEELRRSEAFLAQAQRLTLTGSLWWEVATGEVIWSDETFDVMGVPKTTKPTVELALSRVHPDDVVRVRELVEQAASEGASTEVENRLLMPDGSVKHVQVVLQNIGRQPGKPEFVGAITDVTARKEAELELRRAYDSFEDNQRLSRSGNFTADVVADDHIWSAELYRIFEFDPSKKVTLQAVRDTIHPEDLPSFDATFARALSDSEFNLVFRIVMRSGTVKHLHAVAHLIERVARRPLFIGAIQDVTEKIRAEEALNRARAELAHVARLATLNTLTASIAHEVNQPLTGIITNASTCLRMLDADPPDLEGARETVRRTIRDSNRSADVIKRLRALFTRKEFTLEPLDLNAVTREVVTLAMNELQRERIILRSELAADLPGITGDRVQLQQVVLNLLRNATDAMADVHDRPRHVLITTRRDGDLVRLSVRDTGRGFDPHLLDKLFDAFYTTKSDGMGIGLSVSRSIIETHHGVLWAELNDGPGATFSFTVPLSMPSGIAASHIR